MPSMCSTRRATAIVIVETVGVGQDEVDVARAVHTTVVVSAPGLGDDIQAIKAGILEIADIHVVAKSDRPDAGKTIADLTSMLALGRGHSAWEVPVMPTCALTGDGVEALRDAIDRHREALDAGGAMAARRAEINERRLLLAGEEILRKSFTRRRDRYVATLVADMNARRLGPHAAAKRLLDEMQNGRGE